MSNEKLHKAKKNKNDEYYTFLNDIEKELYSYIGFLKGKKVLCPCDKKESNFVLFFENQIKNSIGLGIEIRYSSSDFRSEDQKENWEWADVIVTNPPFSLFREFMSKIQEYKKDFIIISPLTALHYKGNPELFFNNKLFIGNSFLKNFFNEKGETVKAPACWMTSFNINKPFIKLNAGYFGKNSLLYDVVTLPNGEQIIHTNKVKNIPEGYSQPIAVPETFLCKWNRDQFELLYPNTFSFEINGKKTYERVIIKLKTN